jgi:hypothetical protein
LSFSPALDQAYRATDYHVALPVGEIALRVGEAAPLLDLWLAGENLTCWGVLTACNPGSIRLPEPQNRKLQEDLRQLLLQKDYRIFPGENRAHAGDWPPEPAFFVASLMRIEALKLARLFGQNAFLWGRFAHAPMLCWCSDAPISFSED